MTQEEPLFEVFGIKNNGSDLTVDVMDHLVDVEVDLSLYLPGMFSFSFYDPELALLQAERFKLGNSIDIYVKQGSEQTTVLSGEVTAIEPLISGGDQASRLIVRGYDKSHRLHWGRITKTFLQVTDSDIATQVMSAAGLSPNCTSTTGVRKYVLQSNMTNWDFLQQLALRNNYILQMSDGQMYFGPPNTVPGGSTQVQLKPGENLLEFRPRLTVASQISEVEVRGWDIKKKEAIVGTGNQPSQLPHPTTSGHTAASNMGHRGKVMVMDVPVDDQSLAQSAATAFLTQARAGDLQAEGVTFGNSKIVPGGTVVIAQSSATFNGSYLITRVRHYLRGRSGAYETHFEATAGSAATAGRLFLEGAGVPGGALHDGGVSAMVGLVTNIDDDEVKAGRVKVKLPVMPTDGNVEIESNWLRVVSPGAGASRGIMWHPEVNDEVLVLFDHGHPDGYVLGGLWNGQDAPPNAKADLVNGGQVKVRSFTTRKGSVIRMTDDDKVKIEIADPGNKNTIVIDSDAGKIILNGDTEIDLTTKTYKLKGDTAITIEGGTVTVKGTQIKIEASTSLEMKAPSVKINADTQLEIKGGMGTVDGGGVLTLKGGMVKIN